MKKMLTIKNPKQIHRMTLPEAKNAFFQHCKIKNLSSSTIKYYRRLNVSKRINISPSLLMAK